ncbi:uncharacterized protein LOC133904415 isoform X2 [Phragmites australis]|uniref:uncharacterized protein LOC133904415 isoform X2 n=1 Tax=Phragmites australis TaxID=29695 RepID=UPI002D77386E|nr:uncharacterized protein LOC133904415 isoform X2 [Phragmites australis]
MDGEASKGNGKVHFRDSSSQEALRTYKRRRQPQSQPEPEPEPEPQSQPELEHKAGDVPAQQSKDTFWKSRDMGWKYGIMIDENRQHWKCMYCGLTRYGGGVSRLKRHLAGDLDVKMCPKVPVDVAEEIRQHLRKKRERRRKRAGQNGGNNVKTKSSSDGANFEKDLLPADSVGPAGMGTSVLEEVTNQTSMAHQDPTSPRVPMLRARDIGWEHAVDLDGNKRRWQCKFCSLCRSGGVTTLKAHLTDESCPNVPKEISKKVSNFIEEKRTMRLLFSTFDFKIDEDQVSDTQIQGEGTVQCENEQQPSRNATHTQTLDKHAINEVAAGSNQCGAESSGRPVKHCDQPEEPWAMDHSRTHQGINNKHQTVDKNTENSQNTKVRNCPTRLRDGAWEQSLIYEKEKGHWKCKWCSIEGYHGITRLKWHLVGWQNRPQCPQVPKDVAEKIRDQMILKEEQKARSFDGDGSCGVLCSSKSSQFDQEHFTTTMHGSRSSQAFDQANSKSKACNTLSNTTLPSQEIANPQVCHEQQRKEAATPTEPGWWQGQRMQWQSQHKPMKEEGSHGNELCSNTNKSEKQRSDWRYVLNTLMRLPDVQEGAGIWTCIRDALLYGHAEFGIVADKEEMDYDGTVNGNTAKCQNVLMDVLRSENFALLCNVLCRTVHQDEERTRYFDFGVIDSRMKNGNYGHAPGLFIHDLKLLWEDLKTAGQDIIDLANSLSSLTEDSYRKLVGKERGSDDDEFKGAVMTISGPKNLSESNTSVPSSSQGFNQLDQSDPVDVSDLQKDSSCNQCGKEARGRSVLTCNRCMLSCHISCTELPVPPIPTGSWYCENCSTNEPVEGDMALAHYQPNCLHGNCAACNRLEVCSPPKCEETPNDNSRAMVMDSVGDLELPEIDTGGSCKICGDPEENDKRFLICGHIHCLYKYYHIRCLKSKQIASNVQRDKTCWYCPSCLCRVCLSDKDDDLTILCDGCDEAYHVYCITPRRTSIPKGQWYCSSCSVERAMEGMRQYERRMLKRHRKDDTRRQSRNYEGVDLLLSAAEQLSSW